MDVDVILLPEHLRAEQLDGRAVVVFDVLRATTTMAAALAAGVKEIRVFESIEQARSAAGAFAGEKVLCGEVHCLAPPGFDLGNSPGGFLPESAAGRTVFMSTTNGTRAIIAGCHRPACAGGDEPHPAASAASPGARAQVAQYRDPRDPADLLIGALVNAAATAEVLARQQRDVTLLCAGTGGQVALEDALGAGAVLEGLLGRRADVSCASDVARMALRLFRGARSDLPAALREAQGGQNVTAVGLDMDIDFAARLDSLEVVGVVQDRPLRIERLG